MLEKKQKSFYHLSYAAILLVLILAFSLVIQFIANNHKAEFKTQWEDAVYTIHLTESESDTIRTHLHFTVARKDGSPISSDTLDFALLSPARGGETIMLGSIKSYETIEGTAHVYFDLVRVPPYPELTVQFTNMEDTKTDITCEIKPQLMEYKTYSIDRALESNAAIWIHDVTISSKTIVVTLLVSDTGILATSTKDCISLQLLGKDGTVLYENQTMNYGPISSEPNPDRLQCTALSVNDTICIPIDQVATLVIDGELIPLP